MANSDSIPPEMSWNSTSGGRFSDSDELVVEEVVDLTLPTPSTFKKKLICEFFKAGGASTTNENFAILYSVRTLISRCNFLMFRRASSRDPYIPICRL